MVKNEKFCKRFDIINTVFDPRKNSICWWVNGHLQTCGFENVKINCDDGEQLFFCVAMCETEGVNLLLS